MTKPSYKALTLYFLTLGATGFGGSIALAHAMHKDLVERKKWITDEEYARGLALSQLAPGPLSAQLAIYIGYITKGIRGATLTGISFVLPSFILVVLFSMVYLRFGSITHVQAALYGIGASVVGIITSSSYSLTRRVMKPKKLLWIIFFTAFILGAFFNQTSIFIFIFAGIATALIYTREKISPPKKVQLIAFSLAAPFGINLSPLEKLFSFFLQAGTFAFGGGLAILPFLHSGIEQNHWVTQKQFIDAIAVAMITPGPVVIAASFIGYLVAGLPGAIVSTIAIFLPVYLIVILLTPLFIKHAENSVLIAFVEGVSAAAMGAIAGSVILLGEKSVVDVQTLIICFAAFVFSRFYKTPSIIIIIIAAVLGIFLKW